MKHSWENTNLKVYKILILNFKGISLISEKTIFTYTLIVNFVCTDHEWAWYILSPDKVNGLTNLKFLLSGMGVTIYISVISIIISMILGFIVAIPSLAKNKFLTYINIAYVEIVRAIPLLVLILMGLLWFTNNDRIKF